MKHLIRALCLFLVLWSGLAAYSDLFPVTQEGLKTLLTTFPVVLLIGFLRKDTLLYQSAGFASMPLAIAYLWLAFSPLIALAVVLMMTVSIVWVLARG